MAEPEPQGPDANGGSGMELATRGHQDGGQDLGGAEQGPPNVHRVARTLHLSPQKPYEILKQNCAFKTSRVHALPRHGCVLESRPWGFPWACPGLALGCCTCPAPSLPRTCHSPEPSLDRGKLMGIACTEPALDPSAKSQSCTESRKIPRQKLCESTLSTSSPPQHFHASSD